MACYPVARDRPSTVQSMRRVGRRVEIFYTYLGGPNISREVQIFLKYMDWGSKYFEIIFGPGGTKTGVQIFCDRA